MRGLEEGDGKQNQPQQKQKKKREKAVNSGGGGKKPGNFSNKKQFWTMTDIQNACIPHALKGRDILGAARTGR